MTRGDIVSVMALTMIDRGHNAPWEDRAKAALDAIRMCGAAVVDRNELELLQSTYGFSLPDLTEPQE